jgi:hypothetical protein
MGEQASRPAANQSGPVLTIGVGDPLGNLYLPRTCGPGQVQAPRPYTMTARKGT